MPRYKCTYWTNEGILNNWVTWAHSKIEAIQKLNAERGVVKVFIVNRQTTEEIIEKSNAPNHIKEKLRNDIL